MLPSWIRRTAQVELSAGIAVGRQAVCGALIGRNKNGWEARGLRTIALDQALFTAAPNADLEAALVKALQTASEDFRSGYSPVHVGLPDALFCCETFELDALPAKEQRETWLRWRFARELRRDDALVCRVQELGEAGGKQLLFGQAIDRAWLACVQRAAEQAGVTLASINASGVYRFNRFHHVLAAASGALVSLDPDCWGLLIWDDNGRLRHARGRWRGAAHPGEIQAIADDVERTVLAYVQGAAQRSVERIHIAGAEADVKAVSSFLQGRLQDSRNALALGDMLPGVGGSIAEGFAPSALAAAQAA